MALGLARDDQLAGAPALDAHFTKGERASAPMEKGTHGFWAGPFWCPEPSFFAVLGLPVKAPDGGIPECDCVWVFCCRRSDKAFPPGTPERLQMGPRHMDIMTKRSMQAHVLNSFELNVEQLST